MEPETAPSLLWHLQARFPDTLESIFFPTRQEAVEHAQALVRDYDGIVPIVLAGPGGSVQKLCTNPRLWRGTEPSEPSCTLLKFCCLTKRLPAKRLFGWSQPGTCGRDSDHS